LRGSRARRYTEITRIHRDRKLRNLDMIIRPIRESILAAQGLALRAGFMALPMGMSGSHTSPVFTGNDAT